MYQISFQTFGNLQPKTFSFLYPKGFSTHSFSCQEKDGQCTISPGKVVAEAHILMHLLTRYLTSFLVICQAHMKPTLAKKIRHQILYIFHPERKILGPNEILSISCRVSRVGSFTIHIPLYVNKRQRLSIKDALTVFSFQHKLTL